MIKTLNNFLMIALSEPLTERVNFFKSAVVLKKVNFELAFSKI